MAKQNKTQFVILGMLSSGAKSGYAIRKSMQESTQNFWNESNGQLYPTLAKLRDKKLISTSDQSTGDKSKITYCITKAGTKKFQQWLKQDVDYTPLRSELLLKIFFGENVSADNSLKILNRHKKILENKLETCKTIEKMLKNFVDTGEHPVFYLITVKYGSKVIRAEISWCDESIKLIKQYH